MSELLIELFSEEIPSNLQINARKQLENLLKQNLSSSNLEPKTLEIFSTPTRLAIFITGLPKIYSYICLTCRLLLLSLKPIKQRLTSGLYEILIWSVVVSLKSEAPTGKVVVTLLPDPVNPPVAITFP